MNKGWKHNRSGWWFIILLLLLAGCGDTTITAVLVAVAPTATLTISSTAAPEVIPTKTMSLPPSDTTAKFTAAIKPPALTARVAQTATASPSIASGAPACRASDLAVITGSQGATGSLAISLKFTNQSSQSCILNGRPEIKLLDSQNQPLPLAYTVFCTQCIEGYTTRPATVATQTVAASLNPKIELLHARSANVMIIWSNWCKPDPGNVTLKITLPGNQGQLTTPLLAVDKVAQAHTPRCDASDYDSTVSVGPFERLNG